MASENLVIIGPGNSLSVRHPVFTRNYDDLLSIGPLETKLCDIQIEMQQFSLKKNWISKCRLQNGGHFFLSNDVLTGARMRGRRPTS